MRTPEFTRPDGDYPPYDASIRGQANGAYLCQRLVSG